MGGFSGVLRCNKGCFKPVFGHLSPFFWLYGGIFGLNFTGFCMPICMPICMPNSKKQHFLTVFSRPAGHKKSPF